MELRPITQALGTEVVGVDLASPLSDEQFDRIYRAWIDTTVLLFRGQRLTPGQQVAFTGRFGPVASYTRQRFAQQQRPEILVLSNIREDGRLIGSPVSGRVWHTDGHYLERPPAGSVLHAIEVPPEGGDTWFANMFAAHEALPDEVKARIAGLQVLISRTQSRPYNYPERGAPTPEESADWRDVPQPMVRTHPVNGRKALYAGGSVPWHVPGTGPHESAPLVTFVQEFAVRPQFTYRHRWQPGDLIVWDNRSAMHRATWYDGDRYRRLMHRTTIGSADLPH